MTLDYYYTVEQDFFTTDVDIKFFFQPRGITYNIYYYWKCKSKELKEEYKGQFLPIDVQLGCFIKPSKHTMNLKQSKITQGVKEI